MAERVDVTVRRTRNARLGLALGGLACAMVGLAFAAVPLYRLFCQVTGYGGTTQVAESAPAEVGQRVFKIRFNADVNWNLPWRFQPTQREISVKVGEPGLVFYKAENLTQEAITGTATYNVTPLKAGAYFSKLDCFCFEEQRLAPGQSAELGVSFFVDPSILEDPNLDEVAAITLSYTFFRRPGDEDGDKGKDDAPVANDSDGQQQASAGRQKGG